MRSAPQKQPIPKTAVSLPAGHGPFSGVPSTVCVDATGISVELPGRAWSGVGRSSFLYRRNTVTPFIRQVQRRGLRNPYRAGSSPPYDALTAAAMRFAYG